MSDYEAMAEAYIRQSRKPFHWSGCATSRAPAEKPGPCDCPSPWLPITSAPKEGEILICGGTVEYDAETFPEPRPFNGVSIARWSHDGWDGGYGSEYDGIYWHDPEYWMPLPAPPVREPAQ